MSINRKSGLTRLPELQIDITQDLMRKAGINIPVGQVARSVPEAMEIADRMFSEELFLKWELSKILFQNLGSAML